MADFTSEDLTGSRFEDVYLTDARFHDVDLANARFHLVDLSGATIRGAALVNVDISGEIDNLRVNGVDVVPLVEAELNRRYPDRVKMRPTDADGFREAWDILERRWQRTVGRARGMAPELLHERVAGEWSFIETLRHLVFATDAWVKRAILGEPSPWHPLDLPHDEMPDEPSVPRDRDARPSLDEVLALRADRVATVRQVISDLTDEKLAGMTEPVTEPGYPEPEAFAVRRCLQAIVNEEWEHRLYAERDFDVLESLGSDRWNVRLATADDADEVARLLHDFNTEFDTPSPGAEVLAARLRVLLAVDDTFAIVAGTPPVAVALVTLRPNVWHAGQVALLDELYVVPHLRGRGIGSAIVDHLMSTSRVRGVDLIEINVDEGDVDAQRFYERHGFSPTEPGSTERSFYYARELTTQDATGVVT